MDFKVRCIKSDDNGFTVGKVYETKSGEFFGNGKRNYSSWCDPQIEKGRGQTFESLSKWFAPEAQFELVPDLPRICYILGGEDRPLKVGEKFRIAGYGDADFWIEPDGFVRFHDCCGNTHTASDSLLTAINHPEKIIRQPQFSEDEKALMRLYVGVELPWIARDNHKQDNLFAYAEKPQKGHEERFDTSNDYAPILDQFLPQITFGNSPFDAKAYLEGLK